ncbi:hypothetical protein ACKWTF_004600 [Chironomus riparius]
MTSEPRLPPPKTIDEIINRGYRVSTINAFEALTKRLIGWPNITLMSPKEYGIAYLEQSQNSSAKMALIVDEFATRLTDSKFNIRTNYWTKLEDHVVFSFHDAFFFVDSCFYFRMFDRIIDDLIPTGIMNHLIENYYTKPWGYDQPEVEPKILTVEDLAFGFNIWLLFCLISFIGFIAEHIAVFVLKPIRSYAPVHPINPKLEHEVCIDEITTYEIMNGINPELVTKFRIKKLQLDVSAHMNNLGSAEIIKVIELIDLEN